jgi:uncharacterized protein (UPF0276 family)
MIMKNNISQFPALGFGLGLRSEYYPYIFENTPAVDWFEVISENFMDTEGRPKRNLARIKELYPIVMHGVAMSIGTVDPLNLEYLKKLKTLAEWLNPVWITDHLCWTGIAHKNSHDLLPVPYTEEALKHIVKRIKQVQDYLGRPLALENPSTYLEFKTSHIAESEFIARMAEESGCNLLLDVNNVYVSCYNHRLDAKAYIDALPLDKVIQIHLSGHSNMGTHIIDTHNDHVIDEVWALYKYIVFKAGRTPNTMIEWDDNIPEWEVLYAELSKAKEAAKDAENYAPLPNLANPETSYVANIITPLHEAQSVMQEAIFLGEKIDSKPDEWIRAKIEFAPADQLSVYVNAYRFRLRDIIAEDYPVLQQNLGDDLFSKLIENFVETINSDHFNVSRYALKLPQFISKYEGCDAFALELCTLETAISQLADLTETVPLDPTHLEDITLEVFMESVLIPRAALQLFAFDYPVNDYYIAVKEEKLLHKIKPKKTFIAVFRHDDVIWRMPLARDEYHLLLKLFSGLQIGIALENLQAEIDVPEEELMPKLSNWFSRWMRNGLLAKNKYLENNLKGRLHEELYHNK